MSAPQKWIVTGAGIVVAALSIFAAGVSIAGGSHNSAPSSPTENVRLTIQHSSTPVTTLMHWDASKGPDPFAPPRRGKVRPRSTTPLRKRLHLDTPLLGHYRHSPVRPPRPGIDPGINSYPSKIRMAGYFSGNGVYAVLQTPEQTVVVNPGDRLDDRGKVTEIRPRETKLQRDDRVYDVDMSELL